MTEEEEVQAVESWLRTTDVLIEILRERGRQDGKWGEQNHPDYAPERFVRSVIDEGEAKQRCQEAFRTGSPNWEDVLVEEVAEAIDAPDDAALREELVQVAAVAVAWIECIDRRAP